MLKCPVCQKPSAARAVNAAFPFCSERCKLVDLWRWLGQEYRIPAERSSELETPPDKSARDDDRDA